MNRSFKLSRYVVTSDAMTSSDRIGAIRLVFSTRAGSVHMVDAGAWKLVEDNAIDQLLPQLREGLIAAKILIAQDEDEVSAIVGENERAISENKTLYQVIQPTAWCQLGCGYCGQTHHRGKLGVGARTEFLGRVASRLASGRYEHLAIGWFGAEPLLGLSVIRQMTPILQAMAAENGCSYSAKIVTNGVALSAAVANELFEQHHVRAAEITLDGPREFHDRSRPTKAGGESFSRIIANLAAVAEACPIALLIRCNVGTANASGVPRLIEELAAANLAKRISFYTSPIYSWGNDADKLGLAPRDYASRELDWLALQIRLGFAVGLIPGRKPIVCLSVQREAEVIDADGVSYNCTEVPYVESYGKPNRYAYVPPDGATDRKPPPEAFRLRNFNQDILAGRHPNCRSCEMLPVCGGQCPKAWEEGHVPCPSPKHNMHERLNLLYALSRIAIA